jgi:hypothetical protein
MFYDKPMRHIELHTIESSKDVVTANQIGFKVDNAETCEECFQQVGESPVSKKFAPFVLALDDEAEWVVCFECASPIL